ncbi:MAG: hypothetical protein KDF58_14220, partial [Alphaproteobacteria bacterium]|nr:hypothetical protein [Alphaproteobacteria bacterium]
MPFVKPGLGMVCSLSFTHGKLFNNSPMSRAENAPVAHSLAEKPSTNSPWSVKPSTRQLLEAVMALPAQAF